MHRLFVAIRPPAHIRSQLLDLMEGVREARWQNEVQLHLTLRFIGEVERHQAEDVAAALGTVHHPGFDLALSGLGTFSRRGTPATLWAGVTPHEPLKALHKKIDQALMRAGVAPDRRAYSPHLTLARLGRSPDSIQPLMAKAGDIGSATFPITDFRLYESELSPQGATYSVVARYRLEPSA